jgi:tRNA pseudouridine65 synthase
LGVLMMSVNTETPAEAAAETLDVIYRDEYLIAVHKPSGLLVHRSEIDRHETRFALQIVRDQIGQYVHPVHRLDKPTSGILLMALQKETAQHLMRQFAEQRIHKQYQALVRGFVPAQGYLIMLWDGWKMIMTMRPRKKTKRANPL